MVPKLEGQWALLMDVHWEKQKAEQREWLRESCWDCCLEMEWVHLLEGCWGKQMDLQMARHWEKLREKLMGLHWDLQKGCCLEMVLVHLLEGCWGLHWVELMVVCWEKLRGSYLDWHWAVLWVQKLGHLGQGQKSNKQTNKQTKALSVDSF